MAGLPEKPRRPEWFHVPAISAARWNWPLARPVTPRAWRTTPGDGPDDTAPGSGPPRHPRRIRRCPRQAPKGVAPGDRQHRAGLAGRIADAGGGARTPPDRG